MRTTIVAVFVFSLIAMALAVRPTVIATASPSALTIDPYELQAGANIRALPDENVQNLF
ncbi:MAG TPA: hypothetical protein VFP60_07615 [Pseudolabrys sp.]|nr:hypothetical protein [Pseudolabrys sp.]